mmetsp:Transcript_16634/g.42740  ORF Transcript_16634/g.42740 Transcript_16634/m.42740 type:complete len:264 (-) Transcript_16634:174-965(-)
MILFVSFSETRLNSLVRNGASRPPLDVSRSIQSAWSPPGMSSTSMWSIPSAEVLLRALATADRSGMADADSPCTAIAAATLASETKGACNRREPASSLAASDVRDIEAATGGGGSITFQSGVLHGSCCGGSSCTGGWEASGCMPGAAKPPFRPTLIAPGGTGGGGGISICAGKAPIPWPGTAAFATGMCNILGGATPFTEGSWGGVPFTEGSWGGVEGTRGAWIGVGGKSGACAMCGVGGTGTGQPPVAAAADWESKLKRCVI